MGFIDDLGFAAVKIFKLLPIIVLIIVILAFIVQKLFLE